MTYFVYPAKVAFVTNAADELLAKSTEGPGCFVIRTPEYAGPPPPNPGAPVRTWQSKLSLRALNTPYVNETPNPIGASVSVWGGAPANLHFAVDCGLGWVVVDVDLIKAAGDIAGVAAPEIPAGASYKVYLDASGGGLYTWAELREPA